jgi:hypothetical protein
MTPSSDCGEDLCSAPSPATVLGTALSLSPFIATFLFVALFVARRLFAALSRSHDRRDDGDDHILPSSAPAALRAAHADQAARSSTRRRVAAVAFAATLGLAAVLAELILAEISSAVNPRALDMALRITVPSLVILLVAVIPFLELQSLVVSGGWSFRKTAAGKTPRMAWLLQLVGFAGWLFIFWSVGRAVPAVTDESDYLFNRHGREVEGGSPFDSTGMTIGRATARGESMREVITGEGLSRACLERIGVIGISLMALLSGFASVSSPWHTFADNRAYRKRPVTDADIARKQAGVDATSEMLTSKRHRLRSLQRKMEVAAEAGTTGASGSLVGKMFGSLKNIGSSGGDAAEIKALKLEISGLQAMETSLSSSLSILRSRQAEHARDGTLLGRLLALPSYAFSLYCVYRVLATSVTSINRLYYPAASFSSSDPINRFLGLLAKHWDPKLDQLAWARQISFLLSGVILAASANSVLQTFHLFAKWAPGLVYTAQANLALLIGQIAATYVISAALLLRSNLPREVSRSVGDALESALEPGFVDRWFEGWFLLASISTAIGIWLGKKIGGPGSGYVDLDDDWIEYGSEEMGQKRS